MNTLTDTATAKTRVSDARVASPAGDQTPPSLEAALRRGVERLLADQQTDGHWIYELEADCTIPAEYICYLHYMDERDPALESRIAQYLLARQMENGGWPLFHGGHADLSCTVKAYYALKLSGRDVDSEP